MIEDINIAKKIFGPDIGSIKGKATREKPAPVVLNFIEIPHELIEAQRNITLCIDTMKINGLLFMVTMSRKILYRTAEWVASQKVQVYRSALKDVFCICNQVGFRVQIIFSDNEYKPLRDAMEEKFDVKFNYAMAQEHVLEVKRTIQVIKE
jgi:hypothetical protein